MALEASALGSSSGNASGSAPGNWFTKQVTAGAGPMALPIASYPGARLIGATVFELVTRPERQVQAQQALQARYGLDIALSAMDLSAEAEAFGCEIHVTDTEIPSVIGRLVTNMEQAQRLSVPHPGEKRTRVYLEAVRGLGALPGNPRVLGGCIGPFSLAARLVGVSEAMELTMTEPELMHVLLDKCAAFLEAYIQAFKKQGASGVIMAEPAAGLLSPRALSELSSRYIRRIAASTVDDGFALILHNCAAKVLHLRAILETGLSTFHFGAPMDIPAALKQVPEGVVLCGNLDPSACFVQGGPEQMREKAETLLRATANHRNFVLSSGCDIPPGASLENLDAFYAAVGIHPRAAK